METQYCYGLALWFLCLVVVIPGNECDKELVEGTVTADSDNNSMPRSVQLNITLGGRDLNLTFTQDAEANPDCPVIVLSTDKFGRYQADKAYLPKAKDFALYRDLENNAAIRVVREGAGQRRLKLNLEGIIHSDGKLYEFKSTEGHITKRERFPRDNDVSNKRHEGFFQETEEFKVKILNPGNNVKLLRKPKEPRSKVIMRHLKYPSADTFAYKTKRQVTRDVNIDIVVVADYAVFNDWYKRSTSTTAALTSIKQYYAFVFSGVNMLYKSITSLDYSIHIRLSSIIVSTTADSAPWTELFRQSNGYETLLGKRSQVDAYESLEYFAVWASDSDILPKYDQLMLFTGYDMTAEYGGRVSADIVGLSYTGTLCDTAGKATSIIEDPGGFQCIQTAAHELGHSLSAEHDGLNNSCKAEDQFIMTAVASDTNNTKTMLDPWIFSPCSVNYFDTFINRLALTGRGEQCLFGVLPTSQDIPDVKTLMPGQIYDANEQCRQIYGTHSRHCLVFHSGNASDICTAMFCAEPYNELCDETVAARGTTCGNKKWCVSGQCVYDSKAPAADDNCVFGDISGAVYDGLSCSMLRLDSVDCTDEKVRKVCCRSCAQFYRSVDTPQDRPFTDIPINDPPLNLPLTTAVPISTIVSTQRAVQYTVFKVDVPTKSASARLDHRTTVVAGILFAIGMCKKSLKL